MMNIGFKTGPRNFDVGKRIVIEEKATLCEVWFDVTHANDYQEMISWLQSHNVQFGLHHWGTANGRYKTNLMTSIDEIRETTVEQIKKTILIAKETGAVYVNAHPGARAIETIDFAQDTQNIDTTQSSTPETEAMQNLRTSTQTLEAFAQQHGVLLTIETLPGAEAYNLHDRTKMYNPYSASVEDMKAIAQDGSWIANDITHTATQFAMESPDPSRMWQHVLDFTHAVFDRTRLLHINTVTPPYNGTDSHGGIKKNDFTTDRVPTQEQLVEFLRLFKDREDVFIIPEPAEDHPGNFKALKQLVENL